MASREGRAGHTNSRGRVAGMANSVVTLSSVQTLLCHWNMNSQKRDHHGSTCFPLNSTVGHGIEST